jgi:hypothetical protein
MNYDRAIIGACDIGGMVPGQVSREAKKEDRLKDKTRKPVEMIRS